MKRRHKHPFLGYAFILPSILGFLLFVAYPMVMSTYYSMTDWTGIGKPTFVGWDNFSFLFFQDPMFYKIIVVTLLYVVYTVPTGLALGLLLALLLNRKFWGTKLLRTLYYLPVIIPSIAALTIWKFAFNPDYGFINNVLTLLHLPTSQWLEGEASALPALAIVQLWGVGGTVLILLSGLQSVPTEVYEAAKVEGAGIWTRFQKITFPLITPVLFLQLITGIIGAFQQFNAPQVMTNYNGTGGGPNGSTTLLAYSIYDNAMGKQAFGYAMAEVWVLFLIIMGFTALVFKLSSDFVYYESEV